VTAPVVEHVRDDVARVLAVADLLRLVAELEHLAGAVPCAVDRARAVDREALHAARELLCVAGFDDQVQVVLLDRDVDDAEVATVHITNEGLADRFVVAALAKLRNVFARAKHDVYGMTVVE
jgi:hypothetical protein